MSRTLIIVHLMGVAMAVPVEWKGVFRTPDDGNPYVWGAQKKDGKYADPEMVLVAIPIAAEVKKGEEQAALTGADSNGTAAMALTCEKVQAGGKIVPAEDKCFTLVFDQAKDQSLFTIDATAANAGAIAFYAQHFPTEFESTEHYFKDRTGSDVEPVAQDPVPSGGHSHGTWADEFEGKCVCQAQANNWKLDCTNKQKITDAVTALNADAACKAKSPPAKCKPHYYVMQAHHDHCLHDQLRTGIEITLHDYEQFYDDCFIKRQYSASLKVCPAVDCTKAKAKALTDAVTTLKACPKTKEGCAEAGCSAAMKTVLMAHDTCPEDKLPNDLEVALHAYETPCEAQLCNSAPAAFDPYADPCSASVASSGFGIRETLLVTSWGLPLLGLIWF